MLGRGCVGLLQSKQAQDSGKGHCPPGPKVPLAWLLCVPLHGQKTSWGISWNDQVRFRFAEMALLVCCQGKERSENSKSARSRDFRGQADGDNGERFREQREEVGERDTRCGHTEASP